MLPLSLLALLLIQPCVAASSSGSGPIETFDEHLHVRPLPDGNVNARFTFVTTSHRSDSQCQTYIS